MDERLKCALAVGFTAAFAPSIVALPIYFFGWWGVLFVASLIFGFCAFAAAMD
jgi:hypothetical protein